MARGLHGLSSSNIWTQRPGQMKLGFQPEWNASSQYWETCVFSSRPPDLLQRALNWEMWNYREHWK